MNKMHETECSICMEPLDDIMTTLKCNHKYHSKCILEYCLTCRNEIVCPLCRLSVAKTLEPPRSHNHVTILLPVHEDSHEIEESNCRRYCKLFFCSLPFIYLAYVTWSITMGGSS